MLCLAKVSAIHTIVQLLLCAVTFDRIDWPNGLGNFATRLKDSASRHQNVLVFPKIFISSDEV